MTEEQLQAQCFQWFHNNYPALRGRLRLNLNNPKNKIHGAHCKAMGLIPGTADHVYLMDNGAVWLEAKLIKGVQSPKQIEFENMINNLTGHHYYIYRSINDFKQIIKKYCII